MSEWLVIFGFVAVAVVTITAVGAILWMMNSVGRMEQERAKAAERIERGPRRTDGRIVNRLLGLMEHGTMAADIADCMSASKMSKPERVLVTLDGLYTTGREGPIMSNQPIEATAKPQLSEHRRAYMQAYRSRPEYKKLKNERARKRLAEDAEYRERVREQSRQSQRTPAAIERNRERLKAKRMAQPGYGERRQKRLQGQAAAAERMKLQKEKEIESQAVYAGLDPEWSDWIKSSNRWEPKARDPWSTKVDTWRQSLNRRAFCDKRQKRVLGKSKPTASWHDACIRMRSQANAKYHRQLKGR
jgi:hypothetical protein